MNKELKPKRNFRAVRISDEAWNGIHMLCRDLALNCGEVVEKAIAQLQAKRVTVNVAGDFTKTVDQTANAEPEARTLAEPVVMVEGAVLGNLRALKGESAGSVSPSGRIDRSGMKPILRPSQKKEAKS